MRVSEMIAEITGDTSPPPDAVHKGAPKGKRVDVVVRNSRRNGQPTRLVLRYVNGDPAEGLPSTDTRS